MTRRLTRWVVGLAALLLLSGCGDYRPDYTPPDPDTLPQAARKAFPDTTPPPTEDDHIASATDPLAGEGDGLASPPSSGDPAAVNDALAPADAPSPGDSPASAPHDAPHDALLGQSMPTEHSHWLRGSVFNARVAVSLNGAPVGEFRAPVDKDITMRLRRGVNTVTFTYTPLLGDASAHLDVLEGEHHPPVAPLATFHRSPQMAGGTAGHPDVPAPAATQTLTFIAH